MMYSRLHLQGLGGFGGNWYWSSSQGNPYGAWFMRFGDGFVYYIIHDGKNYANQVRAVRAF
jgi:hypothetical protein